MKILLIGNFAPPYEEENLHNLSLCARLEEEGHQCTIINISETPSGNPYHINAPGNIGYFFSLMRHSLNKDVIHFLTKGYLRVGLLRMMLSIFAGTLLRTRRIVTIHSEFFSILGQMRSPFGGTQTLNTSFYLADRILFTDRDTYNTAKMYMKRPNFELVPSFIYLPEDIDDFDTSRTERIQELKNVILFANLKHPSFLFDVLSEFIEKHSLTDGAGLVLVLSEKPSLNTQHALEDSSGPLKDRLVFIEYDDLLSALKSFSGASLILRPMSCDGTTFFESFAFCAKVAVRSGRYLHFPSGLLFIKDGNASEQCAQIISTLTASEPPAPQPADPEDSYRKILEIYAN